MESVSQMILSPMMDNTTSTVRWNGKNFIKPETVDSHSYFVCWVTRIIVEHMSDDLSFKLDATTYGMFHDFDENFSGDVIHSLKYNKLNGIQIRELIDSFIDNTMSKTFKKENPHNDLMKRTLQDSPSRVKLIVKMADWISMCNYARREIGLGNGRNFDEVLLYCVQSLSLHIEKCREYFSRYKKYNIEVFNDLENMNWHE